MLQPISQSQDSVRVIRAFPSFLLPDAIEFCASYSIKSSRLKRLCSYAHGS